MLENRSFDHILGACQKIERKKKIDGVLTNDGSTRSNTIGGKPYYQAPGAARVIIDDPRHETPHVLVQFQTDSGGVTNSGFVLDYTNSYSNLTKEAPDEIMRYHDLGTLPALHALASNFTVCDHWFASVPGPTWANRLFAMSGTSLGRVGMPEGVMDLNLHWYDQTTIFDRLNEKEKPICWAVYFGDTPLSLLLVNQWEDANRARHRSMRNFFKDAAGPADSFPRFAFIEPAYLQPGANDDHPSHDILAGEALIASVYNALRANEPLWQSTLRVILFDEHGGFYDHVAPGPTVPPDHHQEEYTFDKLGARVPAILVSPWMANDVCSDVFDHTSLLKYLIEKWCLGPLGARAAQANTFSRSEWILPKAKTDCPLTIPSVPNNLAPVTVPVQRTLSRHQNALVALSHVLETMAGEDATVVAARSRQIISGPQSQIDAAVDRIAAFVKAGAVELRRKVE